jgi:hypothetical protein
MKIDKPNLRSILRSIGFPCCSTGHIQFTLLDFGQKSGENRATKGKNKKLNAPKLFGAFVLHFFEVRRVHGSLRFILLRRLGVVGASQVPVSALLLADLLKPGS